MDGLDTARQKQNSECQELGRTPWHSRKGYEAFQCCGAGAQLMTAVDQS
jgi:hypothetical protein